MARLLPRRSAAFALAAFALAAVLTLQGCGGSKPTPGPTPPAAAVVESLAIAPVNIVGTWSTPLGDMNTTVLSKDEKGLPFHGVEWLRVTYPPDATSANEVSVEAVPHDAPEGRSRGTPGDTDNAFALTAKRHGSCIYGMVQTAPNPANATAGCCATVLRELCDGSPGADIDVTSRLRAAFGSSRDYVAFSHTFDLKVMNGTLHAILVAQYSEPSLSDLPGYGVRLDALVAIPLRGQLPVAPTRSGLPYFSLYDNLGSLSTAKEDLVHKIPFTRYSHYPKGFKFGSEQHHMNGLSCFTTADGTSMLGFTLFALSEAVVMEDPWAVERPRIVQRFGTVPVTNGTDLLYTMAFGVPSTVAFNGVHNVYYTRYAERETITIFVNGQLDESGEQHSRVYEFDVLKSRNVSTHSFETRYAFGKLPFHNPNMGGARPLGTSGRVWLTSAGVTGTGLWAVDDVSLAVRFGNFTQLVLYDCFAFEVAGSAIDRVTGSTEFLV